MKYFIFLIYFYLHNGFCTELDFDYQSFFKKKNFCYLIDCDGVLTNEPEREKLDIKDIHEKTALLIPSFIKNHLIPDKKIITFCSAFHDQISDTSSMTSTINLIESVFESIKLHKPQFGSIEKKTLGNTHGYISFSKTYPYIHVLSIKENDQIFFTAKQKVPFFHQNIIHNNFYSNLDGYVFIDDNSSYFQKFSNLVFAYNEYGDRFFNINNLISEILTSENAGSSNFNEYKIHNTDSYLEDHEDFCDNKESLLQKILEIVSLLHREKINKIILPGRSPRYLGYCLELFQEGKLDSIAENLAEENKRKFAECKEFISKISIISIPFSGVPQSTEYEKSLLEISSNNDLDECDFYIKQNENENDHFVAEKNLYTSEGLEKFKKTFRKKISPIALGDKVLIADSIGKGGGVGMFTAFFRKITEYLQIKITILALNNFNEIIIHLEEKGPKKYFYFLLGKIQKKLKTIGPFEGFIIPFYCPFDKTQYQQYSDIGAFHPCNWENGYQSPDPEKSIFFKSLLYLIFPTNISRHLNSIYLQKNLNCNSLEKIKKYKNKLQDIFLPELFNKWPASLQNLWKEKIEKLYEEDLLQKIEDLIQAITEDFSVPIINLGKIIDLGNSALTKFNILEEIYTQIEEIRSNENYIRISIENSPDLSDKRYVDLISKITKRMEKNKDVFDAIDKGDFLWSDNYVNYFDDFFSFNEKLILMINQYKNYKSIKYLPNTNNDSPRKNEEQHGEDVDQNGFEFCEEGNPHEKDLTELDYYNGFMFS